jgi:uncharacterized protein
MMFTAESQQAPNGRLNHHGQPNLKLKARFIVGSLLAPRQTRRWLGFIQAHPAMQALSATHPHLIDKIYRPYLSTRLNCAQRIDALIGHYQFMLKGGFEKLVAAAANSPISLSQFTGKSGTAYQLELSAINISHREGELCLRLSSGGVHLYTATFIVVYQRGKACVKIGCLQGIVADNGGERIKQATRDLHGCRPKNLMVSLVRDMADYFGCEQVLLVSNHNRISINQRRRQGITSNYDQTWEELGAIKQLDGDYALSGTDLIRKNIDDTPSHKRSEARKRNALIDTLVLDTRAHLEQWKLEPAKIFHFPAKIPSPATAAQPALSKSA